MRALKINTHGIPVSPLLRVPPSPIPTPWRLSRCNRVGILKLLRFSNSHMIVGTTQAAQILNISTARLRILLVTGRVKGAYKTGNMWLMPLFDGKPIIEPGKRGPAPSWHCERKNSPDQNPHYKPRGKGGKGKGKGEKN